MSAPTASAACFFRANAHLFAVEGGYMQQVVNVSHLTPVPRSAAHLLGVFAVRGVVLPLIDLGPMLELGRAPASSLAALVTYDDRLAALNLDEVVDVSPLERAAMTPLQSAAGAVQRFGLGEVKRAGERVTVLNIPALFEALETPLEER